MNGDSETLQDALLTGPEAPEDADTLTDSLVADSTGRMRRSKVPRMPRRYEQRVFRGADPSIFSSAAGKIFLEGVGLVPVGGLNLDEAAKRLKERLARIYSGIGRGTTHVYVSLGSAGPMRVFLLGEVKVPGGYVFTGNTTVLSALYFAKGPSDIGSVGNLQLIRGGRKYHLDLYQYLMRGLRGDNRGRPACSTPSGSSAFRRTPLPRRSPRRLGQSGHCSATQGRRPLYCGPSPDFSLALSDAEAHHEGVIEVLKGHRLRYRLLV